MRAQADGQDGPSHDVSTAPAMWSTFAPLAREGSAPAVTAMRARVAEGTLRRNGTSSSGAFSNDARCGVWVEITGGVDILYPFLGYVPRPADSSLAQVRALGVCSTGRGGWGQKS